MGIDTDLETALPAFFSASAARLSAKITAGVVFSLSDVAISVGGRINKSVDEALLLGSTRPMFLLTGGGPLVGGGGGAVGGLGGLEAAGGPMPPAAGGMFPGSTVTRVAGLEYKFPLS